MHWIFVGIALGIGIMLAPYLVHVVVAVVSLLFWLSAGGVYSLVKGIENDTISVWWLAAPSAIVAAFVFWKSVTEE